MKNKMIYGKAGSGKTFKYFEPIVNEFKGRKIVISNYKSDVFIDYKEYDLSNYEGIEEALKSNDKLFFKINFNSSPYFNNENLKKIIEKIKDLFIDDDLATLLAIDEMTYFDLSEVKNNVSVLSDILSLNSKNIYVISAFQSMKVLNKIYKKETKSILEKCELISTNKDEDFSGEIRVRFPKSLHRRLSEKADIEGVSMNVYMIYKLSEHIND